MPAASDPAVVVRTFLDALSTMDTTTSVGLLHDDIEWRNTGLPTLRGKRRVAAAFRGSKSRGVDVEIRTHALAADGDTVLTDRTDVIRVGPVGSAFWVRGTFEVRDGLIRVWDDRYSIGDVLAGTVRETVGRLRSR